MVGGVYYEHAHRLYGMLVGVTAIALLVASLLLDVRPWLRGLAAALLALVAVQGILGGMRVTQANLVLAIVHGVLGQVLFALATAIAAFTATTWHRAGVRPAPTAEAERRGTRLLVAVLLVQLVLGALYRHLNADAAIHIGAKHGLLTVHILVGLLIAHLAVLHGGRAWGRHREAPVLPVVGRTLIILVCVQLLLGIGAAAAVMLREPGAAVPVLEVIVTTAHQATGALLLAAATLLAIWTRRLVALASAAA
jgi:cytochrome c oxidase assembly protein subunit 15